MERNREKLGQRSLAMHRLIAEKIRRDPSLLNKVKSNIEQCKLAVSARTLPYVDQWEKLVDAGIDSALTVATEDSERAAALRQSSPFTGILTSEERTRFLNDWKREHES